MRYHCMVLWRSLILSYHFGQNIEAKSSFQPNFSQYEGTSAGHICSNRPPVLPSQFQSFPRLICVRVIFTSQSHTLSSLDLHRRRNLCLVYVYISCFRNPKGAGISLYNCHCYGKTQKQWGRMEQASTNSISPEGEQNVPPVCTNSDSDATEPRHLEKQAGYRGEND